MPGSSVSTLGGEGGGGGGSSLNRLSRLVKSKNPIVLRTDKLVAIAKHKAADEDLSESILRADTSVKDTMITSHALINQITTTSTTTTTSSSSTTTTKAPSSADQDVTSCNDEEHVKAASIIKRNWLKFRQIQNEGRGKVQKDVFILNMSSKSRDLILSRFILGPRCRLLYSSLAMRNYIGGLKEMRRVIFEICNNYKLIDVPSSSVVDKYSFLNRLLRLLSQGKRITSPSKGHLITALDMTLLKNICLDYRTTRRSAHKYVFDNCSLIDAVSYPKTLPSPQEGKMDEKMNEKKDENEAGAAVGSSINKYQFKGHLSLLPAVIRCRKDSKLQKEKEKEKDRHMRQQKLILLPGTKDSSSSMRAASKTLKKKTDTSSAKSNPIGFFVNRNYESFLSSTTQDLSDTDKSNRTITTTATTTGSATTALAPASSSYEILDSSLNDSIISDDFEYHSLSMSSEIANNAEGAADRSQLNTSVFSAVNCLSYDMSDLSEEQVNFRSEESGLDTSLARYDHCASRNGLSLFEQRQNESFVSMDSIEVHVPPASTHTSANTSESSSKASGSNTAAASASEPTDCILSSSGSSSRFVSRKQHGKSILSRLNTKLQNDAIQEEDSKDLIVFYCPGMNDLTSNNKVDKHGSFHVSPPLPPPPHTNINITTRTAPQIVAKGRPESSSGIPLPPNDAAHFRYPNNITSDIGPNSNASTSPSTSSTPSSADFNTFEASAIRSGSRIPVSANYKQRILMSNGISYSSGSNCYSPTSGGDSNNNNSSNNACSYNNKSNDDSTYIISEERPSALDETSMISNSSTSACDNYQSINSSSSSTSFMSPSLLPPSPTRSNERRSASSENSSTFGGVGRRRGVGNRYIDSSCSNDDNRNRGNNGSECDGGADEYNDDDGEDDDLAQTIFRRFNEKHSILLDNSVLTDYESSYYALSD